MRLNFVDLTSASLPHETVKVLCELLVSRGFVAFGGAYNSYISEFLDSSHGKHGPRERSRRSHGIGQVTILVAVSSRDLGR